MTKFVKKSIYFIQEEALSKNFVLLVLLKDKEPTKAEVLLKDNEEFS